MKNQTDLLLAAQAHAASTLNTTEPLALLKADTSSFDGLNIPVANWPTYSAFVTTARSQYAVNSAILLK